MKKNDCQCEIGSPAFDQRWLKAVIHDDAWHFHRRLYERYGVVLGPGEYTRIIKKIRRKKVPLLKERADGAAIYAVRITALPTPVFIVAWPKGRLLTAMPYKRRFVALLPGLGDSASKSKKNDV